MEAQPEYDECFACAKEHDETLLKMLRDVLTVSK